MGLVSQPRGSKAENVITISEQIQSETSVRLHRQTGWVKNNWPPAALPEIPDEKEETETCASHRKAGIRVGWYSAKLTILPQEEIGPPADDGCDAGKRNFTKVHVDPQLLGNSQTCPKAFNEVVELSVGVSSLLASNTHTSLCLGLSTR
ncbi:hypothetical protein ALC53_01329 [Atta colombica]|uniref:Uncharacterized protein n=1 Tax=Atta colombica TaxID=520822 RepID=A0A195BWC4_9HYME|nr:hypothetical protein ALC53_01329 [Atta colombica]